MWIFFKVVGVCTFAALVEGAVVTQDTPISAWILGISVSALIATALIGWNVTTALDRKYVRQDVFVQIMRAMRAEIRALKREQRGRGYEYEEDGDDDTTLG